jgi:hypothetical protein
MLFPDNYATLIGDWRDPYPAPVLETHDGVVVVRDDLLGAGSKVRFADYLIGHDPSTRSVREWVYGSCPATGYAQISLPIACQRHDKTAVLFMAQRDMTRLHEYQQRGINAGAIYHWVPDGMLSVTQKRARDYVEADPVHRRLLPIGLGHPTVLASIMRVAQALPLTPRYVWSVGSSGTLTRGLQLAWPEAEVHVVSVGHRMTPETSGRAIVHLSPYAFSKPVKGADVPPFPSVPTYDAKAWSVLQAWKRDTGITDEILFWNVGA